VGVIVGAGIYSVLGPAAAIADRAVWASVLLASLPALLTAACYAELVSLLPRAGASYVYVRDAFPHRPWAAFIVGFLVALTAAATTATVSLAFSGYLALFVSWPPWISAAALILLCTAINMFGIREAAWVTAICTLIEVGGLIMIITAGLGDPDFAKDVLSLSPAPVLAGAAVIFFVYTGFEGLANLAEESRHPDRHIPIAMLASLGFAMLLYLLVALAAVALAPAKDLAASDSPLSTAARAAAPWMATALAWIALFSTANTALITLVVASRTLYGMARGGHMPSPLARTTKRRKSPSIAAIVLGLAALTFVPLGNLEIVASVSSLTLLLVFIAVAAALIAIRRRPRTQSPAPGFRIPLAIAGVPVIPILAIASSLALATRFSWPVYGLTAAALAAGVCLYFFRGRWSSAGPTSKESL
jgi:amino acid transporter